MSKILINEATVKLALAALKELVAQTESGLFAVGHDHVAMQDARQAITALREAPAERESVLPGGGHVPAVPVAVYGYCPECGGAGVMRERRPNGDDKCTNGHKYPSSQALAKQPAQQEPVASVRTWHKNGDQHAELDDWGLALALLPDGKHELYTSPPAQRNEFKPDYNTEAVLVEEMQRMAQRILELEALLESQTALLEQKTARIVDLQTHIANLEGEE